MSEGRKSVFGALDVVCAVSVRCEVARTGSFWERGFVWLALGDPAESRTGSF